MVLVFVTGVLCSTPAIPQPKQYTLIMTSSFNSVPEKVYVDLIGARADRVDLHDQRIILINDINMSRSYVIFTEAHACTWTSFKRKYVPFLYFPNTLYVGSFHCYNNNSEMCDIWSGCHPYEQPPAPFRLEAFQGTPLFLNLPSIGTNSTFYFHDYHEGPSPKNTFDIPQNCSQMVDDSDYDYLFENSWYAFLSSISLMDTKFASRQIC